MSDKIAKGRLEVAKGGVDTDTLHSIEVIVGSAHDDSFSFSGSIAAGTQLRIEAGAGQSGDNDINLNGASGTSVRVTATDEGIELTPVGGGSGRIELVGFSYDAAILGSNQVQTVFVGAGKGSIFKAGAGGGDFTLMASDKAYGCEDAVDIFRVTTTAPAGLSEAEQIEYLRNNRVMICNFGAEDTIYVNGVLFDGSRVTATLAPYIWVSGNESAYTTPLLAGESSYNLSYLHPHIEPGPDDNQYVYEAGPVRDVAIVRGSGEFDVINFISRSALPDETYRKSADTILNCFGGRSLQPRKPGAKRPELNSV